TGTIHTIPFGEKVSVEKYEYPIKSLSINILKKYIWEREKDILKDLTNHASKLEFWHVNVEEVVDVFNEDDIVQKLGGNKMKPNFLFSDYFISPMYILSDEIKIEIKNKVMKTFPHINAFSIDQLVNALALIWHVEAMESDSPGPQNDPYIELKQKPAFFKINLPRGITKQTLTKVDLCLPSYGKSGTNYNNPFYDDPPFKETVSLVQKKIEEEPKDIIVLAGVSGGGKTSTAFGIAVQRWSIYIDCSPIIGQYDAHLTSELQRIRGIKPKFDRIDQQNEAFHMLDIAVVSRGLLLVKMIIEGKVLTPKEWLFVQIQPNDSEVRSILGLKKYDTLTITTLIKKINACLKVSNLTLIFDEAQILCGFEYGKYQGSSVPGKEWNLLQGYVAHLLKHPITCLLAGTYMHMASGISLITSVGKVPNLHTHIVLKLPFLSHDDVLRNLDAVIDLTHVTPETRNLLGYILRGRPRNCASFVQLLISKQRSNGRAKDLVLQEFIWSWYNKICSDMAKYLENACEYFGANNLNPETAIMDVLRLRVFYNHKFKEALLQHSIIPCQSPECIVLGPNDKHSNEIEINPSLESYLIDSIGLFLENTRGKKMVDVFVDNIIMLNNISSIGNEFDAVFITAIIQKRGINVRNELNKWKNGQQFDLPSWITPKMKFITTSNLSGSVPIAKYVNDMTYCSYAIQPDIYSGSDVRSKVKEQLIKSCMRFQIMECPRKRKNDVEFSYKEPKRLQIGLSSSSILPNDFTSNEEDNLEREEYDQDLNYDDLDYDLNYAENTKNYRISRLPHRAIKRSELFRFNEYGDLVIIVDDRNMEYVFGPAIKKLVERISKNQENSMDEKE
ncbi:11576_t:CDS:2, partial [Funneliformis caledonium]